MYCDYSAFTWSLSQYYYPTHQPMIYPTISSISPMPIPQLSTAVPTGMQNKKQVCICFVFVEYPFSYSRPVWSSATGEISSHNERMAWNLVFNLPGLCSSHGIWHTTTFLAPWRCTLWPHWPECSWSANLPPSRASWMSLWQQCYVGFV